MIHLLAVPDPGQAAPDAPPWMAAALCRHFPDDTDLWFPPAEHRSATAEAREVCGRCPVARECLEYALGFTGQRAPRGVWGGTSTRQRVRIRERRRKAARKDQAA